MSGDKCPRLFWRQIAHILNIFSRQMEAIVYIGQRQVKVLNRGSAIFVSTSLEVSKFFVQLVCEHEDSSPRLVVVIKIASILESPTE